MLTSSCGLCTHRLFHGLFPAFGEVRICADLSFGVAFEFVFDGAVDPAGEGPVVVVGGAAC